MKLNNFGDVMSYRRSIFIVLLIFVANHGIAAKAQTTVDFNKPEKFTDFKTQLSSQIKDREKLMNELKTLIMAASNKLLPKDQKLEIVISDVDMAGRFEFGVIDPYRVVRDTDKIKLEFTYKVMDNEGNIINEDNVSLVSRNPMSIRNNSIRYNHTHFTYELPVYERWLRKLLQ